MFEVGQKVVCVDDRFPDGIRDIFNSLPVKGRLYTVRDVVMGVGWGGSANQDFQPSVYLRELKNLPNEKGTEPGFACRRFAEPIEDEDLHTNQEELLLTK